MISRTWLAVGVGTLIFAMSMWFGLLAATGSGLVAFVIVAVGLVLASYSIAGFSQAPEPMDVGFRASMYALGVGGILLVIAGVSGSELSLVLTPLIAVGVAGAFAMAPVGIRSRILARLAALLPVCLVAGFIYQVDPIIFGVFMPLIPLIGLGFADRFYDRGVEVLDEVPPNS